MIVVNVFIQDLDSDDVADDVDRSVVVAANPHQAEIVAVGVAADDLQTGEMPLGQPLEVQVVEDVAVDDELIAVLDGPRSETPRAASPGRRRCPGAGR